MTDFQKKYETYRSFAEKTLKNAANSMNYGTSVLGESMRYSLLAGGKRLRPVLFCAFLDLLGLDYRKETGLLTAIECIHTYSLIHDDLPAMDDDDYRRGKLSNHKVFGEANAILAGDGLLSYAFEIAVEECMRGQEHAAAAKTLATAAGVRGMVAGQSADMYYSGKSAKEVGAEELFALQRNKTAKLIAAPLVMAANLAGKYEREAEEFGTALGLLFQITDDLLDELGNAADLGKSVGKDKQEEKLTAVSLFGIEKARLNAGKLAKKCLNTLKKIPLDTAFFVALTEQVRTRIQ